MQSEDHTLSIRGNTGPVDGVAGTHRPARIGTIFVRNVEVLAQGVEDPSVREKVCVLSLNGSELARFSGGQWDGPERKNVVVAPGAQQIRSVLAHRRELEVGKADRNDACGAAGSRNLRCLITSHRAFEEVNTRAVGCQSAAGPLHLAVIREPGYGFDDRNCRWLPPPKNESADQDSGRPRRDPDPSPARDRLPNSSDRRAARIRESLQREPQVGRMLKPLLRFLLQTTAHNPL